MNLPRTSRTSQSKARVAFLEAEINAICHSLMTRGALNSWPLGARETLSSAMKTKKVNLYLKIWKCFWQLGTASSK